jgi:SecD/SecF fusion protein
MQGKSLVRFFLIFMLIIAVWQLFLNFRTNGVEKNAVRYATNAVANMDDGVLKDFTAKQLEQAYLDSVSNETVLNLGLIKYTYNDLKKQQLQLGLDLKGGMSVVMQVDLKDLIAVLADQKDENATDEDFKKAIALASKNQQSSATDFVTLFADAFKEVAPNRKLAELFYTNPLMKGDGDNKGISLNSTDEEVAAAIRKKADETVGSTFDRLKQRIDKFGVTQPNVSLDENTDRIIVELPGIQNVERARKFLQSSAVLEFWDIYEIQELAAGFTQADTYFKNNPIGGKKATDDVTLFEKKDTVGGVADADTSLTNEGNEATDTNTKVATTDAAPNDTSKAGDLSTGPLLSYFDLNRGQYDQSYMGLVNKNDRKRVDALLAEAKARNFFPKDVKFLWSQKPFKDYTTNELTDDYVLYAIRTNNKPAPLEGDQVASASPQLDQQSSEVAVSLTLKRDGARAWGNMTEKAFPTRKSIAIALDGEVVSAPHVQAVMKDGRSQITGNFSATEAQDFANILQVGKLPAKTEIIEENIVGPSLGQDNINSSIISLIAGLAMVLIFMLLYYSSAGLISILALLANLVFIYVTLSSLGTVVTLPGIAGIVLTMGMAVDANVIIFERIREELRDGKSLMIAIKDGFANSYSAIIDGNVTTLLTGIILFYFGLGPIKGFAAVLIVGVLSSMFTAVLVSRLVIDWWTEKKGKNLKFDTNFSKAAFSKMNVDFIGKRKIAYIFSGSIIVLGLVSMLVRGFELGVDFKGGRSYAVHFDKPVDRTDLKDVMTKEFESSPSIKTFGDANTFEITTTYLINSNAEDADAQVLAKLYEGVKKITGEDEGLAAFARTDTTGKVAKTYINRSIKVGPTIADDITKSSFEAGIFALLIIFLYILIRFNKWQYSAGAVIALFHDVLIVLSVFSIFYGILPFSLEIDQAFIAAVLTVIGYSINDTVIVFDRVREYANSYTADTKKDLINKAINNTLSRTSLTSLTTLFVVLVLFLFGGSSIVGFAFALVIGITFGTYSSIFIATPIMYDLTSADDLKPKTVEKKKNKYASSSKEEA